MVTHSPFPLTGTTLHRKAIKAAQTVHDQEVELNKLLSPYAASYNIQSVERWRDTEEDKMTSLDNKRKFIT